MNFKVISTSLFLLAFILATIKNFKLPLIILMFASSILSYFIIYSYTQKETKSQNYLRNHPMVRNDVTFKSLENKQKYTTGYLIYKNENYKFFFKTKMSKTYASLKNKTCYIKGDFKFDNEHPSITISSINLDSCKTNGHFQWIYNHQEYISNKIYHSGVKYPNRILALITGNTTLINPDYKEKVKEIGIYHLLAISGTHIAAIILIIHQSLVRFNTPLLVIKILTICVLVIYAIYTDFVPSAVRAISIAILVILLPKSLRKSSLNLLSLIFIIMYIVYPGYIYNIGFQFSFLICFFILMAQPFLKNLTPIKSLLAITCIAQFGSIIISVYHFNQFQWIGFLSNLLFVPFYSFLLFPSIILFFITSHLISYFEIMNRYMAFLYNVHDLLLNLFYKLSHYKWYIPDLSEKQLLLFILSIFIVYYLFVHQKVFISLSVFIIILSLLTFTNKPSYAELTLFDVGQGDSILFKTGNNKTIMIDTGGKGDENKSKSISHHNIAKFKILPSLKRKGISTIDYLILTHPHADHMGELPYLFEHLKIKNIILNSDGFPNDLLKYIIKEGKMKNIKIHEVKNISQINFEVTKLKFFNTFIPASSDKNEQSIIILIQYRNKNILLMGDATKNNESILLQNYKLPKIDILKVGHHGSRTSSSEEFVKNIQPKISLISSGKHNKYHLPNDDVISRLKENGSEVYDTQDNGELSINLDDIKTKIQRIYQRQSTNAREVTQ